MTSEEENLHDMVQEQYKNTIKSFRPQFGSLDHIKAVEYMAVLKKKKLSESERANIERNIVYLLTK